MLLPAAIQSAWAHPPSAPCALSSLPAIGPQLSAGLLHTLLIYGNHFLGGAPILQY